MLLILVLLGLCQAQAANTSTGEVELFDAVQSSTYCTTNPVTCKTADRALLDNSDSCTDWGTGTHWWRASMANTTVYQISMAIGTKYVGDELTVSLYSGEEQVWTFSWANPQGQKFNPNNLIVPGIYADKLEVEVTSDGRKRLTIMNVKVIKVRTPGVASFALASSTLSDAHSPDLAIDNDLTTYAATTHGSKSWYKVYLSSTTTILDVTFKSYCFSYKDVFVVYVMFEGQKVMCGRYKCDVYGEITETITCDGRGNVIRLEHRPNNDKLPLILFDIKWSG